MIWKEEGTCSLISSMTLLVFSESTESHFINNCIMHFSELKLNYDNGRYVCNICVALEINRLSCQRWRAGCFSICSPRLKAHSFESIQLTSCDRFNREALGQATHLLPWVLEHSVRHPIGHTIADVWKTFSTFYTDPLNKIPIDWTLPSFHRKAKTALQGSWMMPPWTIKSNWEVFILNPGECSSDARDLSCCPEGLNMVDIKSLMRRVWK